MKDKSIVYQYDFESPLGTMKMTSDGRNLTGLWFSGQKYTTEKLTENYVKKKLPVFQKTIEWLEKYFAGKRPDFMPDIEIKGTEFRKEVWEILLKIPYGETRTYGEIAAEIAEKRGINCMSAQAVGGAVGHNPVAILIPCHRVLGNKRTLTGYAGGIEKKAALLQLEGIKISAL